MSIKCGTCKGRHESVAEVRSCSGVTGPVATTPDKPTANGSIVLDRLRRQAGLGPDYDTREEEARRYASNPAEQMRREAAATRNGASREDLRIGRATYGRSWEDGREPDRYRAPLWSGSPATSKMVKYVTDLLDQREVPEDIVTRYRADLTAKTLSFSAAREFINRFKDAPRKGKATSPLNGNGNGQPATTVTEDGYYRNPETGEIYKVQWNKASGTGRNLYAKLMVMVDRETGEEFSDRVLEREAKSVKRHFEYRSGLIREIKPEWRMSMDEAQRFGELYGICLRCGRDLTAEESIERAMGPVCAGKANWS